MNAYLDSSVLLRVVLGQPGRLAPWNDIRESVASALVEVECIRTVDRLRLRGHLTEKQVATARAAQPLPTALGTLDAIHLATATLWKERRSAVILATHDNALALAAKAVGLQVVGVATEN